MATAGSLTNVSTGHRIKQIILIILFSIVATVLMRFLDNVLLLYLSFHRLIVSGLTALFAHNVVGNVLLSVFGLVFVPFCLVALLAGIYWLIKRQAMPYAMETLWISWLVLLVTIVLQGG